MSITSPLALVLLLVLVPVVYLGWPRTRFRRTRDISSLLLRVTIIVLVVTALAGVQIVQSADRLAVVFLLDVSDSMGTQAQDAATKYIQQAMDDMKPDDLAAVVAFGAEAHVARSMSTARELGPIRADPVTGNTNLAAAIRLGLALFPGDAARRMVVLSDGQVTIGDTDSAAQLAAAAGVELSYVQFTRPPSPEIRVKKIDVPTVVDENQEFDLTVTIASEEDTRAVVTVMASGDIITRQEMDLRAGENNYTIRLVSGVAGFRDWLVQVDPLGEDGFYQNNALGAFSRVEGASRVLVVGDVTSGDLRYIIPALEENGLQVDVTAPDDLPLNISGLAQYDSVVLVNVSAVSLSNRRMEVLDTYVSDLGGGLVVIGGPDSYGPGGYFQTPLEDALPVEVQIRDQQRLPQLTIAYIIDRSGSMGATGDSGVANIDLAKGAIIRSIDFLQPTDRAGVASFDTNSYWVAEIQDVLDKRELQRLVGTLRSSGGTSIRAGMELVARDIVNEPSQLKHIILLTDGGAEPRGLVELTGQLYQQYNVTTSVISIGQYEASFLKAMAEAGNGNYHHVVDPETIPEIFSQETVLATRTYIQEDEFTPLLTARHPIMQNLTALPLLEGYVATSERPTAQVILRGPEPYNDPLLAAWQYGLGRSVAFTSDATGRWARNWVSWDEFATFWGQAVRWTITEGASSNLETRVVMEDEHARIQVDARDNAGEFLNGLNLQASVVFNQNQSARRVQLRQTAPGRYEGTFTPEDEGAYLIRVTDQATDASGTVIAGEGLELTQTSGWVMSYSPEYDLQATDDRLLESVAVLTDGQDLSDVPEEVYKHNLNAMSASVPLWPWLLFLALVLLPFDVGVRRLLVTRSDLRRLNAWVQTTILQRPLALDEANVQRMSNLREARDRARTRVSTTADNAAASRTIGALRSRQEELREQREQVTQEAETEVQQAAKPRYDRESAPMPPTAGKYQDHENIGARLLKNRRRDDED